MKRTVNKSKLVSFIAKHTGFDRDYISNRIDDEGAASFNEIGFNFAYLGFSKWSIES